MGQEARVLTVMENPQPPASLADPQAGSSEQITVPDNSRARMAALVAAKLPRALERMLTSAPS